MFGQSMAVSAIRCTLSYLVLPFVLPLVGVTAGLDAGVGLVLGPVAVAANLVSIHRFRSSRHSYRRYAIAANVVMIAALVVLFAGDLNAVLS